MVGNIVSMVMGGEGVETIIEGGSREKDKSDYGYNQMCGISVRLKELLRNRLKECGWREQLKNHCRGAIMC